MTWFPFLPSDLPLVHPDDTQPEHHGGEDEHVEELRPEYVKLLFADEESVEWRLVKAADRICAYVKCLEELKAGNREFARAEKAVKRAIDKIDLPEVALFMKRFVPSFVLTLDELN